MGRALVTPRRAVMRDPSYAWESLLARLFTDNAFRARFTRDPMNVGRELGLDASALAAFADADWVGLELAARSYERKRTRRSSGPGRPRGS
jgi:hypothetical protein